MYSEAFSKSSSICSLKMYRKKTSLHGVSESAKMIFAVINQRYDKHEIPVCDSNLNCSYKTLCIMLDACGIEPMDSMTRDARNCTNRVAKTKALICFAVTAKLICAFVFV